MSNTDSVRVAVLGAFEPLTAMLVGILCFGEPMTWTIAFGFLLILIAVVALILQPMLQNGQTSLLDVAKHLYPTRRSPEKRHKFVRNK